jgi:hypothetical protein
LLIGYQTAFSIATTAAVMLVSAIVAAAVWVFVSFPTALGYLINTLITMLIVYVVRFVCRFVLEGRQGRFVRHVRWWSAIELVWLVAGFVYGVVSALLIRLLQLAIVACFQLSRPDKPTFKGQMKRFDRAHMSFIATGLFVAVYVYMYVSKLIICLCFFCKM